jgi:hypothetical protein
VLFNSIQANAAAENCKSSLLKQEMLVVIIIARKPILINIDYHIFSE